MHSLKPRTRRGFTLIEMVVIIILMAVLASIIVPSYTRFWHRTRFMGAVNDVADLIADARERAISKDTPSTITYFSSTQTFKLEVTPPTQNTDIPKAMQNGQQSDMQSTGGIRGYQLREGTLVQEFSVGGKGGQGAPSPLSANQAQVLRFREDGTNEGGRITMVNENGYGAMIRVMPSTGQIIIDEM
ncbi:MAG: prepilin-type N-terminal cleavage/methylation domain-containing protein [Armatimonadetes bacterium]|nr:prepilin-type N-terminal cleavage/methylation domain-containing protein [Armatimonadota bacterium]